MFRTAPSRESEARSAHCFLGQHGWSEAYGETRLCLGAVQGVWAMKKKPTKEAMLFALEGKGAITLALVRKVLEARLKAKALDTA